MKHRLRHGKRAVQLSVLLLLFATVAVHGQSADAWSLARVAARALEADPAVRASGALAGIASVQYELELDRARPKFGLNLTPFSYDVRRVFDFTSSMSSPPGGLGNVDSKTASFGAGIAYNQALPTAGAVAVGVKSSFGIADKDCKTEYSLSPTLNASLRQPLFAGGQFLPFGVAAASRRSVEIGSQQALLDDLGRRNQAVRSAVETAGRVLVLRSTLAVQEASLSSALKRAEYFSLRRGSGTATEDAALEFSLSAELVKRSLVDTRLALADAERRLASVLGIKDQSGAGLLLPELSTELPVLVAMMSSKVDTAPDALRSALASEKAKVDAAARATIDAPVLGAAIVVAPRYADARDDASDTATVLSDLLDSDNGAGFNWNVSATLDWPLSGKAAREHRSRLDALSIEAAEAQRLMMLRSIDDRMASIVGRRDALIERLSIQRRIVELEKSKTARQVALADVGTVTVEDAADALAKRDGALAEALRLELDLLLAELDLRALAGEDIASVLAGNAK